MFDWDFILKAHQYLPGRTVVQCLGLWAFVVSNFATSYEIYAEKQNQSGFFLII